MSLVLPKMSEVIERGIAEHLHPGAQVCVMRRGEVVVDWAIGEARPGIGMTVDHILPWMSCTKPVVATAVMRCVERGLLRLGDPVAKHIPEFGVQGKEGITIWHLLTHTAGLRAAGGDLSGGSWEEVIERICAARPEPNWVAGERAGYHVGSSWFVLGELVKRVTGRGIEAYVGEEIFRPLGMGDCRLSICVGEDERLGDRLAMSYVTDGSAMNPRPIDVEELSKVKPGGSGMGPARELARFYQMLLNGGDLDGARVLDLETVREMTRPQRGGMRDETFGRVMDWGLGVMVNNAHLTPVERLPYNFGRGASSGAFGHGGAQCCIAFVDPSKELVVVILFNGMPGEVRHHQRMGEVLGALWGDLGGM